MSQAEIKRMFTVSGDEQSYSLRVEGNDKTVTDISAKFMDYIKSEFDSDISDDGEIACPPITNDIQHDVVAIYDNAREMPVRITKTKETKKNNMQLITKLHDEKQVETFRREFAKFHRRLKHQGLDISFENYLVTDSTSS